MEPEEIISEMYNKISWTDILLFASSSAFGAYRGYCHSKGIYLDNVTDFGLAFGPTLAQGAFGAAMGATASIAKTEPNRKEISKAGGLEKISHILKSKCTPLENAVMTSMFGAMSGGVQTWIGYGIGCGAGYFSKLFE